ncbi:hypothetical protein SAMN05421858_1837 [Haladaptatus litoreus]|uniref:DUF2332 domain-containing protein n=1 Tax=Haladaptatus litoreus TaxID=553468 RepID=A0A1N6Z2G9_9EURY|nr:DUF2332 domain-containing protein [Haladaptatus litoreus]SIR21000.1 hypothetical protein SAMN05421858_1837 [Haladaptatus litoreus]
MSLAEQFEWFADWCVGTSPLYEEISREIADDPDLLAIAEEIPPKRGTPNILFAAIHWHLLGGANHELAEYYPTLTDDPKSDNPFPAFREFCLVFETELLPLLRNRRTQTNAVRRCTALFPAFSHVSKEVGGDPLALVELGPSGGLNLCWHQYAYDYGDAGQFGTSDFVLDSEIRSEKTPPISDDFPAVASRIGIDLNPLSIQDEKDVRWLRALIWPEHGDRHRLLQRAADVAQQHPPELRQGDAIEELPDVLAEIPDDVPVCVFDTQMRYQLPDSAQDRLRAHIESAAQERTIHWLSGHESTDEWDNAFTLDWFDGEEYEPLVAYEQHGKWIRWLL